MQRRPRNVIGGTITCILRVRKTNAKSSTLAIISQTRVMFTSVNEKLQTDIESLSWQHRNTELHDSCIIFQ